MTRINLYPWRDALDERKKRNFIIILVMVSVTTCLFTLGQSMYYSHQILQQEANNEFLNNQIILTNKKLRDISKISSQKKAILERISVLQELDSNRHSATNLFNEMVSIINPLVTIKRIKRETDTIKVVGHSDSNSGIAKFLRDIELSPHFDSAELDQIKVLNDQVDNKEHDESKHFFEMKFIQKISNKNKITEEENSG